MSAADLATNSLDFLLWGDGAGSQGDEVREVKPRRGKVGYDWLSRRQGREGES